MINAEPAPTVREYDATGLITAIGGITRQSDGSCKPTPLDSLARDINIYEYTGNRPMAFRDPFGKFWWVAIAAAVGAVF